MASSFERVGITQLRPWQADCLQAAGLDGKNLVLTAPTAGGKTVVAQVLMSRALSKGKRCLVCVPLRALADELAHGLQELWGHLGYRIKAATGGKHSRVRLGDVDVAICTIESCSSLLNRIFLDKPSIRDASLASIGCLVVDEAHNVQSPRGVVLETLLAKVLVACPATQIVAMSATLPGVDTMGRWLNATLYDAASTSSRPEPITELLMHRGQLFTPWLRPLSQEALSGEQVLHSAMQGGDGADEHDGWLRLVIAAWRHRVSTIVFCPTKKLCHACCERAWRRVAVVRGGPELVKQIAKVTDGMPTPMDRGVAFHHGDLGNDARRLIEQGFRDGVIRVLFSTSTLASGVNLPVRWVIVRSPKIGIKDMGGMRYVQMAGRAGRGLSKSHARPTPPQQPSSACSEVEAAAEAAAEARRLRYHLPRALCVTVIDSLKGALGLGDSVDDASFRQLVRLAGAVDPTLPLHRFLSELSSRILAGPGPGAHGSPKFKFARAASAVQGVLELMTHKLEPLRSAMADGVGDADDAVVGARRMLLEAVACGFASSAGDLHRFYSRTLWGVLEAKAASGEPAGVMKATLEWLIDQGMLQVCEERLASPPMSVVSGAATGRFEGSEPPRASGSGLRLRATRLGLATTLSALAPEEAVFAAKDIVRAQSVGLSLECEGIHAFYLLAPVFRTQPVRWTKLKQWLDDRHEGDRAGSRRDKWVLEIARRIGVDEGYVRAQTRRRAPRASAELVHQRFWNAIILHTAATSPDPRAALKVSGITQGGLDRLQEDAATFCGMVLTLCSSLSWKSVRAVLGAFEPQLGRVSSRDPVHSLTVLKHVNAAKAHALFKAGYLSPCDLAGADAAAVAEALKAAAPFHRSSDDAARSRRLWLGEAEAVIDAARAHQRRVQPSAST